MAIQAIHLDLPEQRRTPVVFASPHSGRNYPGDFLSQTVLDDAAIRSSEDAFVDVLFSHGPACGAPLLSALAPRAYIDLNRNVDELDSALIAGVQRANHNPRVASGLGVVPRVVAGGRAIYRGKLSRAEAQARIDTYWRPYHTKLNQLLRESLDMFDQAILIDCHSMPHEAVSSVTHPDGRPEIVLGDRFGAAAHPEIVDRVERAFRRAGLKVARNAPFAGAFSTQHYGRPSRAQHAIQIEIDRALYMDEEKVRPNRNFKAFRKIMDGIVEEISEIGSAPARQLAAE